MEQREKRIRGLSAGKVQVEKRNDFKIAKQYPLVTKMKEEFQGAK